MLSSLFMGSVLPTPLTVLVEFDPVRIVSLILLGRIIAPLALCAS